MRKYITLLAMTGAAALVGCAGPEHKLGRGINNMTEIVRGGEIRRSVEQSALFEGPEVGYTTGLLHGINRTLERTFIGAYEVVTFPLPSYDPLMLPADPVYPDSYRPDLLEDSFFATDTYLGFSSGDVAPILPGSRFHIFDP